MFNPFDRSEGNEGYLRAAKALMGERNEMSEMSERSERNERGECGECGTFLRSICQFSNQVALLKWFLRDASWVGVYLLEGDELVLGPFQGLPACERIRLGNGVCGTAAMEARVIAVKDVNAFPGHIACDSASRSEIAAPFFFPDGKVAGVLDVDSPIEGRFSDDDVPFFSQAAAIMGMALGGR